MFEEIKKIILEQLDLEETEIKLESSLIDELGADSLDVFEILSAVETEYKIEFTKEEMTKVITIKDIIDLINLKEGN